MISVYNSFYYNTFYLVTIKFSVNKKHKSSFLFLLIYFCCLFLQENNKINTRFSIVMFIGHKKKFEMFAERRKNCMDQRMLRR